MEILHKELKRIENYEKRKRSADSCQSINNPSRDKTSAQESQESMHARQASPGKVSPGYPIRCFTVTKISLEIPGKL